MISKLIQLLVLALLPSLVIAETAQQQQLRVDHLEHAVLAPCCYTEPVAIHRSEIAVKMRLEIAKSVAAGRSDREIIDTYVGLIPGPCRGDGRLLSPLSPLRFRRV